MSLKPDAQYWQIQEQIVEDPASGLTFQFEMNEGDPDAPYRLRIFGDLPFGNREIMFNAEGKEAGAGTLLAGLCKPAWTTQLDD